MLEMLIYLIMAKQLFETKPDVFMKMKSHFLAFGILMLVSFQGLAQRDFEEGDEVSFKDRLYFGGNFGLQFGSVTFIDVSPLVGYMITPKLSAGVGFTYQYYSFTDPFSIKRSFNIYGGRLFGRYNISEQFFAYSEYESIGIPYIASDNSEQRDWVPAFYVGGGYVQRFGNRGGIGITALYNLLYSDRAISNSPFTIRVGFFI